MYRAGRACSPVTFPGHLAVVVADESMDCFLKFITIGGRAAQRMPLPQCTSATHFHLQNAAHIENQIHMFAGPYASLITSDYSVYNGENFFNKLKLV